MLKREAGGESAESAAELETDKPQGPFTIGSVEPDLKKRFRYLIYAEGGEQPVLSVHEDIVVRYRLLKGSYVTAELAAEIADADGRQTAYALAIGYLGFKPRTAKELERYLKRKEMSPEAIAGALDRLQEEKLVDDGEYARQFAEQRVRSQLKGSRLIRQELAQRGIGREEATGALEALAPEAELAAALKAARKKWPYVKGEGRERRQRLAQFLGRRGYPSSVVFETVKTIAAESEEENGLDEFGDGSWLDN